MGPVGILCVQRTLEKGRKTGFYTGVGATISDLFYSLLTGFGLSFIEEFLERNQNIIQLLGSVVLIGFGIYLFRSNPTRNLKKPDEQRISAKRNILNGFLFTFSNPLIIFLIIGLFARFNFMGPSLPWFTYIGGYLAIAVGALCWWWFVSFSIDKIRSHFNLRSMWLINKIIGGIVLIFALVGIFSSVSALASAREIQPRYLNSQRGFSPLGENIDAKPLRIENPSADTVVRLLPAYGIHGLELTFRASNIHNVAGKTYPYIMSDGRTKKISHPAWGIRIIDTGHQRRDIILKTSDQNRDETYFSPFMEVALQTPSDTITQTLTKDLDLHNGRNAFSITLAREKLSFSAGNRKYRPILSSIPCREGIDSIGFVIYPGGAIEVDWIALEPRPTPEDFEITRFGDPNVRHTYFSRSTDPKEGIWSILDHTYDDAILPPGGDYRLAMVRADDGYQLIYLDGARVNSDLWGQGMIKARLHESGLSNTYNVEWIDADGQLIQGEVKARYENPVLTILFPGQKTTIRMQRISE
ncbi:MAG: LysE family translocator [Bacteroidales bacterium]|nr:LysE family translocator [Bacteroidales bacterium]